MENTLSSAKRPPTVVLKALDLNLLKKNLRRKLSIDLLSRDGGKKRMGKPPPKHMSLPPVANTAVRKRELILTDLPLSCFSLQVVRTDLCRYTVDHPYFTRSKGPTDSFPNQNSQRGKATMSDNNEEPGLTDVMMAQPTLADQNELILQLMQQIVEMRVEMQRK
uniref:Uncharacterized protein n=1 Tax=Solanum tuberosum TaxID=4113 RepID=M1AZD7_SOLTU